MTLPPAPRRAVCKAPLRLWLARIFTLPHLGAAIFLTWLVSTQVLFALLASRGSAEVTGGSCEPGKRGQVCRIGYRYVSGERALHGEQQVSEAEFARLAPDPSSEHRARVAILHLELGPYQKSSLASDRGWAAEGLLVLFWLFLCAGIGRVGFQLWVAPAREERLCERGAEATGRIASVRTTSGRGRARFVKFEFRDRSGATHAREMQSASRTLPAAEVGQEVTVLFDPDDPSKSVAYEFSAYRVEE